MTLSSQLVRPVLRVADLLHPIDDLVVELFLDGDVGHGRGWRGAVPVLLAGREPDDVARADFLHRSAFALHPAEPAVTIRVCPSGCVCQAVRAPGSKVTLAPRTRRIGRLNSGSMRTVPVNQSAGPLPEGCEPLRLISIAFLRFHAPTPSALVGKQLDGIMRMCL